MSKYDNILNVEIIKKKIDEVLEKSKHSGKEHGFNICSLAGEITATEVVGGDSSSITLEDTCPEVKIGSVKIASFHSHTDSRAAIPSTKDLSNLDDIDRFVCIGVNIENTKDREIKCFDNDDLKPLSYFKIKKTL